MHSPGARSSSSRPPLPRLPDGAVDTWPVTFTASESAYARIWLRGLLLTLLSAGLYLPWARIACQRYLLQHTRVAGRALDDLRSPWPLLVRQGLAMSLLGGVMLAGGGSLTLGLLTASLALAVWPMLQWMGLTQRIQRVTWAKRRLGFDAQVREIYRVLGLPLGGLVALVWLWWLVTRLGSAMGWLLWGMALGLCLLAVPFWLWRWWQFRQTHILLGALRLQWRLGPQEVFEWLLQALGSLLLGLALALGLAALLLGGLMWAGVGAGLGGVLPWLLACGLLAAWVLAWAVLPEAAARAHLLVWGQTGNAHLRVRCNLSVAAHARMRLRHGCLLLVTLGLYWPWAEVQARRLRMNATVVQSRVSLSALAARWPVK